MSTFDKRQEGFENKFAHDEELRFKASARRNKMLGAWAAEKLGVAADEVEAYVKSVVMADFEEPGDEDVYRKVMADFTEKNIDISEHQLRREMTDMMAKAVDEIQSKG
ncbi:MAG: DUF1476 domain-containing protein [Pseudomonadota bacterium]